MKSLRHQIGFTLVELVMVIVLVGVISIGVNKIYAQVLTTMLTGQDITDAMWQGRLGIERMVKEIRATRSAVDITTFTSGQYSFTEANGASVSYALSGGSLTRNGVALADGISSLAFTYYDKNGNVTATAASISYIGISMNVTQNNTNFTLTTGVYLRDLSS